MLALLAILKKKKKKKSVVVVTVVVIVVVESVVEVLLFLRFCESTLYEEVGLGIYINVCTNFAGRN